MDLVWQIKRRKFEFLHQTTKATDAGLLPAIELFQSRRQSQLRHEPAQRIQDAGDHCAAAGTAFGFVRLAGQAILSGGAKLSFADIVCAVGCGMNDECKQIVIVQQPRDFMS